MPDISVYVKPHNNSNQAWVEGMRAAESGLEAKENPYIKHDDRESWAAGHNIVSVLLHGGGG